MSIRGCWNIKSRNQPNVICGRPALYKGEYCIYHHSNIKKCSISNERIFEMATDVCKNVLTRFFKKSILLNALTQIKHRGIGIYVPGIVASNMYEISSFESVDLIPVPYRISYRSGENNIWVFDVRSLYIEYNKNKSQFKNPFTMTPFSDHFVESFIWHVNWLQYRKYNMNFDPADSNIIVQSPAVTPAIPPVITGGDNVSPLVLNGGGETAQSQPQLPVSVASVNEYSKTLIEIIMYIDSFGYMTSPAWFMDMNLNDFRYKMTQLWNYEMGLTQTEKNHIFPSWKSNWINRGMYNNHTNVISFIKLFLFHSKNTEYYMAPVTCVLTAVSYASNDAYDSYGWLLQDDFDDDDDMNQDDNMNQDDDMDQDDDDISESDDDEGAGEGAGGGAGGGAGDGGNANVGI